MVVIYILNLFFLMSPTQSFNFNSFKYFTRDFATYVAHADTTKHETRYLEQKLDNFDEKENRTWRMRYFRRHDMWKTTGPIYIFLGGESETSSKFLYTGMAYELANETNGALYATEHRYYGVSIPVNRNAPELKDLKYLSAKQALADNANLIRTIKRNPDFRKSRVVVIGGSYAGNLATWMRLLYPDLVDAAIASSAPVLAKKDFYEYMEKVSSDFEMYGTDGCWNAINDRFKKYEKMFRTKEGIEELKKNENICAENDMNKPENKQLFFLGKAYVFMDSAQNGDVKWIKSTCLLFNMTEEQTREKTLLLNEFSLWDERRKCKNMNFNEIVEHSLKNTISDTACWIYQTCTEFGYFQCTSSDKQPFTNNIPLSFYIGICTGAFGTDFNDAEISKGVHEVNNMYGGLTPNVTNVVFVNGDLDPWSRLGVLKDLSANAPAIVIPRASHCRDLFSNRIDDEKELIDARKNIKDYIKKWIGAHEYK